MQTSIKRSLFEALNESTNLDENVSKINVLEVDRVAASGAVQAADAAAAKNTSLQALEQSGVGDTQSYYERIYNRLETLAGSVLAFPQSWLLPGSSTDAYLRSWQDSYAVTQGQKATASADMLASVDGARAKSELDRIIAITSQQLDDDGKIASKPFSISSTSRATVLSNGTLPNDRYTTGTALTGDFDERIETQYVFFATPFIDTAGSQTVTKTSGKNKSVTPVLAAPRDFTDSFASTIFDMRNIARVGFGSSFKPSDVRRLGDVEERGYVQWYARDGDDRAIIGPRLTFFDGGVSFNTFHSEFDVADYGLTFNEKTVGNVVVADGHIEANSDEQGHWQVLKTGTGTFQTITTRTVVSKVGKTTTTTNYFVTTAVSKYISDYMDLLYRIEGISGTSSDDVFTFGAGTSVAFGQGGADSFLNVMNDTVLGGAGNDTMVGGRPSSNGGEAAWNNYVDGGDGRDLITMQSGSDMLFRSLITQQLVGAGDTLIGGSGADTVFGGSGADLIFGDSVDKSVASLDLSYDDSLYGGDGADTIAGGFGNDAIYGDSGANLLMGGDGDDTLIGGADDEELSGDAGNDKLFGDDGNDVLSGGAGNDMLSGETGDDSLYGGAGNDSLSGGAGADMLLGEVGNDTLRGGQGNDILYDAAGRNLLFGEDGDDVLVTSFDAIRSGTTYDGGAGNDVFSAQLIKETGIVASLTAATDALGNAFTAAGVRLAGQSNGATLVGIENVEGTETADVITGDGSDNTLSGLKGDDRLYGLDGVDYLHGGGGADSLYGGADHDLLVGQEGDDLLIGGAGSDTFVFEGAFGRDVLTTTQPGTPEDVSEYDHDVLLFNDVRYEDLVFMNTRLSDPAAASGDLTIAVMDRNDPGTISRSVTVKNFDNSSSLTTMVVAARADDGHRALIPAIAILALASEMASKGLTSGGAITGTPEDITAAGQDYWLVQNAA